jgi:peptidyl-prolyl cis-trans isomerase B (cyclophilin B)
MTLADDQDAQVQRAAHKALGAPGRAPQSGAEQAEHESDIDTVELRRLVSPRARVTIRDVGTLELALFTTEAPATVLRFARLADAGHFNDSILTAAGPTAASLVPADSDRAAGFNHLHEETGLWPHVRGAVGLALDGSGPHGAMLFVNLVDNPRLDHEVPVFGQVLNGIDILDRILVGDVIERIEIVP